MVIWGFAMLHITPRATLHSLSWVALCWFASVSGAPVKAQPPGPGSALYGLTTETGMPNLEENLRYITTHSRHCLDRASLYTAFPILDHPALKGCRLIHPTRQEDLLYYDLSCEDTHGTTGQAIWRTDQQSIRGILHVKLGGQNMTFYQRVTAVYQGVCKA
jgi:hypothetical protein